MVVSALVLEFGGLGMRVSEVGSVAFLQGFWLGFGLRESASAAWLQLG